MYRLNDRVWAGAVRQLSCPIAVRRLSGNSVGLEPPERHDVVVSGHSASMLLEVAHDRIG